MSTVLGLSVAKDEALGNATEDRDVAKASAEEGLIDGVVDAVVGWINGTSDARTVYNVAAIGLTAARGVAWRTALGVYDVADINRALDASQATQATNSARNLANAQAERDAVVNRPQSEWSSQAPFAPMSWFGSPFTAEEIAAQQASQYRETMDAWGVTALRTWIAEVDAAGVLDDEPEQAPASPNPGNNPADNGSNPGDSSQSGSTTGTGGDSASDWRQQLQTAQNQLNGILNGLDGGNSSTTSTGTESNSNSTTVTSPTTSGDPQAGAQAPGGQPQGAPPGGNSTSSQNGGSGNGAPPTDPSPPPLASPDPSTTMTWMIDGKPYRLSPADAAAYRAAVDREYSGWSAFWGHFDVFRESSEQVRLHIEARARAERITQEWIRSGQSIDQLNFERSVAWQQYKTSQSDELWRTIDLGMTAVDLFTLGTSMAGRKLLQESGEQAVKKLAAQGTGSQVDNAGQVAAGVTRSLDNAADAMSRRAAAEFNILNPTCFAAGTPILTPRGSRAIEDLREGDEVFARSEFDPNGDVRARRIETAFRRAAQVVRIDLGGQSITTTAEHPFYRHGDGWARVMDLRPGDLLVGQTGETTRIDRIEVLDQFETVYNFRVAKDHTYFVGSDQWGFSVWVHNAYASRPMPGAPGLFEIVDDAGNVVRRGLSEADATSQTGRLNCPWIDIAAELGKQLPQRPSSTTYSETRNAALRRAKEANDIPLSAQPSNTFKPNTPEWLELRLDDRNAILFEYTNSSGQKQGQRALWERWVTLWRD